MASSPAQMRFTLVNQPGCDVTWGFHDKQATALSSSGGLLNRSVAVNYHFFYIVCVDPM